MSLSTLVARSRGASRAVLVLFAASACLLVCGSPALADGASLEVAPSTKLDPAGSSVTVTGSGYEPNTGLFVVNCDPSVPKGGVCDMANFQKAQTDADGAFEVKLKAVAVFGQTDCAKIPCGIQTSKVGDGGNRTQERTVPIGFAGGVAPADGWEDVGSADADAGEISGSPSNASDDTSEASADEDSGSSTPIVIGALVLAAAVGTAAFVLVRRRRQPADIQ